MTEGVCPGAIWRVGEYIHLQLERVRVEDMDLESSVQGGSRNPGRKACSSVCAQSTQGADRRPWGKSWRFALKLTKPKLLHPFLA